MSYEQPSGVSSAVRSISIAADASLAATSHDNGMVILWKLPNSRQTVSHFEELHVCQAHEQYVRATLPIRVDPETLTVGIYCSYIDPSRR